MGIPVIFLRSSSYTQWDYCQLSWYFTYALGYQQPTQKKANLGSIVHKVLECLAQCKQRLQFGIKPNMRIEDGELGTIKFTEKKLNSNKFVITLLDLAYKYYTEGDKHNIYDPKKDYDFCRQMVDACLTHNNGQFDPRKMRIVAPEKSFIIDINEPWAKFTHEGKEGTLCIKGTMDLITEASSDTLEYVDYKGLPLDTLLPTPNGWSSMGTVEIGDELFDIDGKITKVIGKSEIKNLPCYQITFDDTSTVVCDNEHLWTLIDGSIVKITDLKLKDKISVAKPLEINNVELPIDPYVLGIWLGDGRNRCGEISGADIFIFDEIKRRGYKIGDDISSRDEKCKAHTVYGLTTELRKLNLLHNKHIPSIYLRASYSQRLDLLRGLMDSDGSVNSIRKQAIFTNCNRMLSNDVKQLLLTLGQRPLQSDVYAHGFGLTVKNYPLSFKPININPFLIPRKADRVIPEWGHGDSHRRLIKKIELVESVPTQCIMVDSSTHTFLCTENMIPTHNTGARKDWATGEVKDYDKLMKDPQLLLYYYAISKLYPQYDSIIMSIFFLRDGGPFSLCFEKSDNDKFVEMLRVRFEEIRRCESPKPINKWRSDFRCQKLCHYYKTKWPGTEISMCNYVEDEIKLYGIDKVNNSLKAKDFTLGYYQSPGQI